MREQGTEGGYYPLPGNNFKFISSEICGDFEISLDRMDFWAHIPEIWENFDNLCTIFWQICVRNLQIPKSTPSGIRFWNDPLGISDIFEITSPHPLNTGDLPHLWMELHLIQMNGNRLVIQFLFFFVPSFIVKERQKERLNTNCIHWQSCVNSYILWPTPILRKAVQTKQTENISISVRPIECCLYIAFHSTFCLSVHSLHRDILFTVKVSQIHFTKICKRETTQNRFTREKG